MTTALYEELRDLSERETRQAMNRLEAVYDDHDADHCWYCGADWEHEGPDTWVECDARYHFWKANDEFSMANAKYRMYNFEEAADHVYDGLNHIFMAIYIMKYTDIEK